MKSLNKLVCAALAALMLIGSAALCVSAEPIYYRDVETDRWSLEDVAYVISKGYMVGVGDGYFDPEGEATRAMAVTVLWRMAGEPVPAETGKFDDVEADAWYAAAADWSACAGVSNGVAEGRFSPSGALTREMLVTMLCRFADYAHKAFGREGDLSVFSDSDGISSWARHPAAWAVNYGVVLGTDEGEYAPKGLCTREQFAAIVRRFEENVTMEYAEPELISRHTEKEYPLVEDADIYVSTTGDDSAAGTKDAPVRTFARAVEMVRSVKAEKETSVVVAFFAGEYGDPAVTLGAEDSGTKDAPVVYCAYGDGEVLFSGGAVFAEDDFSALDEDEKAMFSEKAAEFVKKADMSEKYPDYSITDVLFGDSGSMTVARYPNKYPDGSDQLFSAGYNSSENTIRITNSVFKRRIAKYHTVEGLYLYGLLTTGWYKDLLETDGYTEDPETGGYDFLIPHPESARMGSLRYGDFPSDQYNATAIVNVSEELDSDGEFFVDAATDTLYVFNPTGSYCFTEKAVAIDMDRADYITFRGFTLTAYSESMIRAMMCHGVTVDRCTVTKCAGDFAINIDGCAKGRDLDCSITESYFSGFACRPVRIVGDCLGSQMFDRRGNVEIYNNFFSFSHLTKDDGAAVQIMYCSEAHVHHNEFEDIGRCAIDYGGCHDFLAEYNSFKRCMYNSSDGGVFYSWNRFEDWGNVIRYNVFYPCQWYGVYIDDDEPGTSVYGNIFFDQVAVVVHDGRNNSMNENILIESEFTVTPGNREEVIAAKESGDIESLKEFDYYKQWKRLFDNFERYPELKAGFLEKYPEVFELSVDLADIDSPAFVLNPTNEIRGNAFFSRDGRDGTVRLYDVVEDFVTVEDNLFFGKDENPYFVDPSVGDYRMRGDADFPDVHFELMGRE